MKVAGRVAIVTGAGGGIGGALAEELAAHGARVVVADLDAAGAQAVADDTAAIRGLITLAEQQFGPVDLYFANAGIVGVPSLEAAEADWDPSIDVNLWAHIRAAQLLVPGWVEPGEGYFVSTASTAGLTQIGRRPTP